MEFRIEGKDFSKRELGADAPEFEGRRDAVILYVWCESCGHRGELIVRQHKGATEIYWQ